MKRLKTTRKIGTAGVFRALLLHTLTLAIAAMSLSVAVSAHNMDVLSGKYNYLNRPGSNMTLVVNPTAIFGSNFTSSFFNNNAYAWNSISSGATINNVVIRSSAMAIITDAINVEGNQLSSNIRGEVKYFNSSGTLVTESSTSISRATITLNNSISLNSTEAKRTFIHELGHVFMLAHPMYGTSYHSGNNTSGGYPYAIMNPHDLGVSAVISNSIEQHDKDCLKYKWGV